MVDEKASYESNTVVDSSKKSDKDKDEEGRRLNFLESIVYPQFFSGMHEITYVSYKNLLYYQSPCSK